MIAKLRDEEEENNVGHLEMISNPEHIFSWWLTAWGPATNLTSSVSQPIWLRAQGLTTSWTWRAESRWLMVYHVVVFYQRKHRTRVSEYISHRPSPCVPNMFQCMTYSFLNYSREKVIIKPVFVYFHVCLSHQLWAPPFMFSQTLVRKNQQPDFDERIPTNILIKPAGNGEKQMSDNSQMNELAGV